MWLCKSVCGWRSFLTKCQGLRELLLYEKWKRKCWHLTPQPIRRSSLVWQKEVDYSIYWPGIGRKKQSKPSKEGWENQATNKSACLQRETNFKASWRLWFSSPSVLFCQCAGPWEVRQTPLIISVIPVVLVLWNNVSLYRVCIKCYCFAPQLLNLRLSWTL